MQFFVNVAENTGIEPMLPERRQMKRKRFANESLSAQDDPNVSQEDHFRNNVFYVLLDCVIGNMANRYESIYALESMFGFLWKYLNMNESEVHGIKKRQSSLWLSTLVMFLPNLFRR